MNEIKKKGKKTSFGADFGTLGSNVGPQKTFYGFYVNQMLETIASYYCIQF